MYRTRAFQCRHLKKHVPQVTTRVVLVGDTGFEPVTSSVSRKRATTAPIARGTSRWRRDLNPCRRICSPLPRLSATPPRRGASRRIATLLRADDEARTRDLNLGKVALYQLSYVRLQLPDREPVR